MPLQWFVLVRLFEGGNMKGRRTWVLCVLALVLALCLAFASPAFAGKPATYWPGGLKLTFTPDAYGHIDVLYPACSTSVDTYMWSVYDPTGEWIAGSNTATPTGQFTPTITGRYKVTVNAMIGGVSVDSLKGAYRYTAP